MLCAYSEAPETGITLKLPMGCPRSVSRTPQKSSNSVRQFVCSVLAAFVLTARFQVSTHAQVFRGLLQTLALEVSVLKASLAAFLKLLELNLETSPDDTPLRHNIDTVSDVLPELGHIPSACSEWVTQVNHALSLAPNVSVKPGTVKLEDTEEHLLDQDTIEYTKEPRTLHGLPFHPLVHPSPGDVSLPSVANFPNAYPSESLNTPQSAAPRLSKRRRGKASCKS